jgi:predicted PurR-regulated permease PerM
MPTFFNFLYGALAVLILYIAVQKLESWILVPKIMQKTVGTSPVVIIFALLIGVKLGGIVGLLLAVPVVAIFTVLKEEWKG